MSYQPNKAFGAVALERATSLEQLDHLVSITRRCDWILSVVIFFTLGTAFAWGILRRVPTRAQAEGIFVSSGGRVVDAVSGASGRLASIDVSVGDRVIKGQVIAGVSQTEVEQRYRDAMEVRRERESEHETLKTKTAAELALKTQNFAKLEEAFNQIIKATDQRITYLTSDLSNLEGLLAKGYTTRRNVEDRRHELTDAQQRKADTQNEILKLKEQRTDLETQRQRDIEQSQYHLNEARRQVDKLAGELGRDTAGGSPIPGRALEVKGSPGSVLNNATPLLLLETTTTPPHPHLSLSPSHPHTL